MKHANLVNLTAKYNSFFAKDSLTKLKKNKYPLNRALISLSNHFCSKSRVLWLWKLVEKILLSHVKGRPTKFPPGNSGSCHCQRKMFALGRKRAWWWCRAASVGYAYPVLAGACTGKRDVRPNYRVLSIGILPRGRLMECLGLWSVVGSTWHNFDAGFVDPTTSRSPLRHCRWRSTRWSDVSAVEFMTLRSARRARVTVSKVAGNHGAHQRNLLVQRNFLDRGIGVQAGLWNFLGYSLRSIFIVTARAGEADSRATHASGFDQRNSSCLN